jgi:cytochrome c oxidase subunit 2
MRRSLLARALPVVLCLAQQALASPSSPSSPTNIFAPASTPADSIFHLSRLVLGICAGIFVVVFGLLVYVVVKFRHTGDDNREPAQVYGSNRVELAWTVVPCLIVIVLFLATARVVHSVQDAPMPPGAIEVTAVGHQFWWEYRYSGLGVVTANELHIPVSDPKNPTPTYIHLRSADTDHSFWVPRLAGKTDLIPNRQNEIWLDPHETGIYLGQCAQYCGIQHAKMLLRVYVEPRADFDRWVAAQKQPAEASAAAAEGRHVFETTSCINCHNVSGTVANGRFGPDLTHLMSREKIASGIAPNTPEELKRWIRNPDEIKPGVKMPAMQLSDHELDAVTAYLATLK